MDSSDVEKDNKEDPRMLLLEEDTKSLSKEEIPCFNCGKTDLETVRGTNGDDVLRCQDCRQYTRHVETRLVENQEIKVNIKGLFEAEINKKCRKCRENLVYRTRENYTRFSNRNLWDCPNGCTRKKGFRNEEVTLLNGKTWISIYDIVPSKKSPNPEYPRMTV